LSQQFDGPAQEPGWRIKRVQVARKSSAKDRGGEKTIGGEKERPVLPIKTKACGSGHCRGMRGGPDLLTRQGRELRKKWEGKSGGKVLEKTQGTARASAGAAR